MPGFLSSLLGIGGTIVGNLIAPGIGGAIGGALGGAVGGAIGGDPQAQASSTAAADQTAAQREVIAARQLAASQVAQFEEPWLRSGYGAQNALNTRLGLASTASYIPATNPLIQGGTTNALTGTPVGAGSPSGLLDGMSQLTAGTGDLARTIPTAPGSTPAGTVRSSDPTSPDYAGLDAFPMPGQPPPGQVAPPSSTIPQVTNALTGQPINAPPPSGAPLGSGVDPGTYGTTGNPVEPGAYEAPSAYAAPTPYDAPKPFSFTLDDYKASPGFQYQLDQARKGTLAGASATGALQSGAAMKALQDRAQNLAYLDFNNERSFANGLYNTINQNALTAHNVNTADTLNAHNVNTRDATNTYDLNRGAYTDDRNYLTDRFDTQTGNLFRVSTAGQNAATTDANAAVGAGTGIAAADTAIGNAQAGNALQQGNLASNRDNQLGGLITSAYQNFSGGSGSPLTLQTAPTNSLQLAAGQTPTSLNFLPPIQYNF